MYVLEQRKIKKNTFLSEGKHTIKTFWHVLSEDNAYSFEN